MTLLIISLIVSFTYCFCNWRNSELREANRRAVKPMLEPYKVPIAHLVSYYLKMGLLGLISVAVIVYFIKSL